MGAPDSVIQTLQTIQNLAARVILMAPRHHHSTPLLQKLHWLPISERIKYKVVCMCFHAINGSGPTYLSELLRIYTPSRTLRSSSDSRLLKILQYKRKTHGFRTFTYFGPYVWNSLPQDIRQCSTLTLRRTWKPSFLHSTSVPVNFSSHFSYQKLYPCVCVCMCFNANNNMCVCVCMSVLM